jgi:predicted Fe-Mo cluster-binding NifX family protein
MPAMKLAIPSAAPGGLEAAVSPHFGHCDAFTLVTLEGGQVGAVEILPNGGHEQGGCLAPVMALKQAGAQALVAGGMGMRPLRGFQDQGIEVFFSEGAPTVGEAAALVAGGRARPFGPAQTCGGGGGGCGGH